MVQCSRPATIEARQVPWHDFLICCRATLGRRYHHSAMTPQFGYTGSATSDGPAATAIERRGHRQGSVWNRPSLGSTAHEPLPEDSSAGCTSLLTGRERVESNPPWGGSP